MSFLSHGWDGTEDGTSPRDTQRVECVAPDSIIMSEKHGRGRVISHDKSRGLYICLFDGGNLEGMPLGDLTVVSATERRFDGWYEGCLTEEGFVIGAIYANQTCDLHASSLQAFGSTKVATVTMMDIKPASPEVMQTHIKKYKQEGLNRVVSGDYGAIALLSSAEEALESSRCGCFMCGTFHAFPPYGTCEVVPQLLYPNLANPTIIKSHDHGSIAEVTSLLRTNGRYILYPQICVEFGSMNTSLETRNVCADIIVELLPFLLPSSLMKLCLTNRRFYTALHIRRSADIYGPRLALSSDVRIVHRGLLAPLHLHRTSTIRGHSGPDNNNHFATMIRMDLAVRATDAFEVVVKCNKIKESCTRTTGIGLFHKNIASLLPICPEISYKRCSNHGGAAFFCDGFHSLKGMCQSSQGAKYREGDCIRLSIQQPGAVLEFSINNEPKHSSNKTLDPTADYYFGMFLAGVDELEVLWLSG